MSVKKTASTQMTTESTAEVENSGKKEQAVNSTLKEETFIYIGPTTKGLIENTIVKGTRKSVEDYLKDVVAEIPQIKMLIVPTESLATNRAKVKQAGTLLNKYYNDVLSLSRKAKEV